MIGVQITQSYVSTWCAISCNNPNAYSLCLLITFSQLRTGAATGVSSPGAMALSHCLLFSNALVSALQLTTFGVGNWRAISCSKQ